MYILNIQYSQIIHASINKLFNKIQNSNYIYILYIVSRRVLLCMLNYIF